MMHITYYLASIVLVVGAVNFRFQRGQGGEPVCRRCGRSWCWNGVWGVLCTVCISPMWCAFRGEIFSSTGVRDGPDYRHGENGGVSLRPGHSTEIRTKADFCGETGPIETTTF